MIGRISSPGTTHSDATEKPIDRALGGMAIERVARMPGARIASVALMTECAISAIHDGRRERKDDQRDRHHVRGHRQEPQHLRGSLGDHQLGRVPRADDRADDLRRLGDRDGEPACAFVEAEHLGVEQRGQ